MRVRTRHCAAAAVVAWWQRLVVCSFTTETKSARSQKRQRIWDAPPRYSVIQWSTMNETWTLEPVRGRLIVKSLASLPANNFIMCMWQVKDDRLAHLSSSHWEFSRSTLKYANIMLNLHRRFHFHIRSDHHGTQQPTVRTQSQWLNQPFKPSKSILGPRVRCKKRFSFLMLLN